MLKDYLVLKPIKNTVCVFVCVRACVRETVFYSNTLLKTIYGKAFVSMYSWKQPIRQLLCKQGYLVIINQKKKKQIFFSLTTFVFTYQEEEAQHDVVSVHPVVQTVSDWL